MHDYLDNGYKAEIVAEGTRLNLFAPDGCFVFSVAAPEFATFVSFSEHAIHGLCPLVSFELGHEKNGWPDWYCKVDISSGTVNLLNPWR